MSTAARTNPDFNDAAEAQKVAAGYASINRHAVHGTFFDALQCKAEAGERCHVLDIGAGSGDDAMILARMGHSVVATEPAKAIRDIGMRNTAQLPVSWIDATIGELGSRALPPRSFDAMLLSAVWQYAPEAERIEGFKTIAQLAKPNAMIRFQFPSPPSRVGQHIISAERFAAELEAANQTLPPALRLKIEGEPIITKDSRDRIGIDGTPVYFLEFTVRSPSRAAAVQTTPNVIARS